jgi:cytochrome c oxidase cbb3-type subunit IV
MDIIGLRIITTVFSLILFVGIWLWAWSKHNKKDFEEAANLPLREE